MFHFGFPLFHRISFVNGFAASTTSVVTVVNSFDFSLYAKSGTKKKRPKDNTITVNRNAYRNYEILETIVAGISLVGTEVKSIRDGKMNIRDGFCKPDRRGTCTLHNVRLQPDGIAAIFLHFGTVYLVVALVSFPFLCNEKSIITAHKVHIGKHTQCGPFFQHEERRVRTLLLHKSEARKLAMQTETQGMTVVPLKAYFDEQNKVKFQLGLARGKNVRDKRADIKERDTKRETRRMIKNFTL